MGPLRLTRPQLQAFSPANGVKVVTCGTGPRLRAGVDIGADTNQRSCHGRVISCSDRQAGDLLFRGSQGNTDHVAIYLGNGEMLEAAPPRDTGSVHETAVYGSHILPWGSSADWNGGGT